MTDSLECKEGPRKGIVDLWNSELYREAEWTELDNPLIIRTSCEPPKEIISWQKAKRLHKKQIANGNKDYRAHCFVHCYFDDQKFDGIREGIWTRWKFFYEVASHFDGILGPDFSTNADFPEPVKRIQFHKMRAIEHGAINRGMLVIPNARWGTPETWAYCFDALPANALLAIGVVGSGLTNIENRPLFEAGIRELVKVKNPWGLIVVGSDKYEIFEALRAKGVTIIQFDSDTCSAFKDRKLQNV